MEMILTAIIFVLALCAAGFVYVTASVNAEADREDSIVSVPPVVADPNAFMRALAGSVSQHVLDGNEITLFQNGVEIFPALLDAIASARESVHFSTFVYEPGNVARRFADAFSAAAKRGAEVRVVIDKNGSKKIPRELIAQMRDAGCEVSWFRSVQWFDWAKYDHRTHRKLLVLDGVIAFTGGVGIADEWDGNADSPAHWRDTHVRIVGPAVATIQAAFVDTWNEATGELPIGAKYFPELAVAGVTPICAVQSNPVNATSAAQRSMAVLIAGSSRRLWITNAYFVPNPPFVEALCAAKSRGVDVKILMPGRYQNESTVGRASRRTWRALLAGKVELYEYERTMIHAKIVLVDSLVTSIGSINFDPRSFALNAEFGVVALDKPLAAQIESAFTNDLRSARRITADDVRNRPRVQRVIDILCYCIRAQL